MATPSGSSLDVPENHLDSKNNVQPPSSNTDSVSEKSQESVEKFAPGWGFVLAFTSLAVITLMAALDATSISVALPVGTDEHHSQD
jgi:hypothetical protein